MSCCSSVVLLLVCTGLPSIIHLLLHQTSAARICQSWLVALLNEVWLVCVLLMPEKH